MKFIKLQNMLDQIISHNKKFPAWFCLQTKMKSQKKEKEKTLQTEKVDKKVIGNRIFYLFPFRISEHPTSVCYHMTTSHT